MNRKLTTGVPHLQTVPVVSPWYHLGIDFIGPLSPPGEDGSRYNILTISDFLLSWWRLYLHLINVLVGLQLFCLR